MVTANAAKKHQIIENVTKPERVVSSDPFKMFDTLPPTHQLLNRAERSRRRSTTRAISTVSIGTVISVRPCLIEDDKGRLDQHPGCSDYFLVTLA